MIRALAIGLIFSFAPVAMGQIVISEWMYSGANGEFVEFTNVGAGSVDMTGWSFDDDSQVPGTVDLSAFGVVDPGESVILTEALAADFATAWGLTGVTIIGELTANLGRNDQINLYDDGDVLVDQLSYGDETYPGTPRTQYASCNIPDTDYGYTVAQTSWVLASLGDAFGSRVSSGGDIASPGRIVGYALSDFDQDGYVDIADFDAFACCMTGAGVPYDPLPAECGLTPDGDGIIPADADQDYDVDLADFAVFQTCFSGEGNPADPSCGYASGPSDVTYITLNGDSITVDGSNVTVDGTTATITAAGTYDMTGTLNDGQIIVNAASGGVVELILNGVDISNSTNAPVFVMSADSVEVVIADQTVNYLDDADTYVYEDPEEDEPNACLFSKDTMLISGTGSLTVYGNYNDAITSKDELVIEGGTIDVIAVDDGIRGKDYLLIQNGDITVTSGGDGLKSDNDEDPLLGYIMIQNGTLDITSGGDGMAAETDVTVVAGDITIVSGGGHTVTIPEEESAKGIKGGAIVAIEGGTFDLDCADDGVHSNDAITISGGNLTIATNSSTSASYGDGVHADSTINITGGTITVTTCYEGVESPDITIDDGTIYVTSTDDGINAAANPGTSNYLQINGGYIVVYAAGDGIDVNGSITMTGGTVIVHGPTVDYNSAIDYDATFHISGGFLVAVGSSQMAQAPSASSTQRSIKITYNQWKTAGTLIHLETTLGGTDVLTFAPAKSYKSCVFSSPYLQTVNSYKLYRGGSSTGTVVDGLYQGGVYTPGTLTNTFTITGTVTNVNAP